MNKITGSIFLIISSIGIFQWSNIRSANAIEKNDTPIVLELFTSQSCSSCPPADNVLGALADKHDNVIALSCNVTYWNHLHWKDTLSKEFCTQRQRQYVSALQSRGPYTPQIVINGKHEMVGSRSNAIKRTLATEIKNNTVKPIELSLSSNNLSIKLPETPGSDSYALHLIAHGARHTQSIPSGENRGRTVNYTNPVQKIISLGTWDGTGKNMSYDISELDNAHGYAVLAQKNGVTGNIMAAGKISP